MNEPQIEPPTPFGYQPPHIDLDEVIRTQEGFYTNDLVVIPSIAHTVPESPRRFGNIQDENQQLYDADYDGDGDCYDGEYN